ncbi:MAG: hypothetical protein JXA72_03965 [Bacteroidales bacterium]|nr:hypothetical protein [Bacteroidales bacterium]
MKIEENTEKKLYSPPDFYILDFKETLNGDEFQEDEDVYEGAYSTGGV